jgi:hypothetical protein
VVPRSARRDIQTDIINLVRMYQNVRPVSIGVIGYVGYNFYMLPREMMSRPQINQAIRNCFIDPVTGNVSQQRIPGFINHTIGLCYAENASAYHILRNEPYPPNNINVLLFIPQIIPQILEVTIPMEFTSPREVTVLPVETPTIRRLVSSYVKEWDITLDLTSNCRDGDTECVICLDTKPSTHIIQTNCGHEYCIECVKNDIHTNKSKTAKPTCPLCRTELCEIRVNDITEHSALHEFIISV